MLMEDVVRQDILKRLETLRKKYEQTLEELKEHDTKKYRGFILPVVKKRKLKKIDIIINYVKNQKGLTLAALVNHLATDLEYAEQGKNPYQAIRDYVRSLIKDKVLHLDKGFLFVDKIDYRSTNGMSGEEITEFVKACLRERPMCSQDMIIEARREGLVITANRLRGIISVLHVKKQIVRKISPDPHTGWTYHLCSDEKALVE